jgi:hypothetical protein
MDNSSFDFRQRLNSLLDGLTRSNSRLALRYSDDSRFRCALVEIAENLGDFYSQVDDNGNALQIFERKLRRWLETPPDSYIGFWGELNIADWLVRHQVLHRFVQETQGIRSPDIELTVVGRKVYFEIKTLQENPYDWFAQRLLAGLRSFLPNRGVSVEKLIVGDETAEALVSKALQIIRDNWRKAPYSPIQYKGDEGEFSIVLPLGGGIVSSWPDSRIRKDGTPWLESQLEATLRDNIEQFRNDGVTFLVWVNFDKSLPDIQAHVSWVIERLCKTEFVNVAGVIISDPFLEWGLVENISHLEYGELKRIGLFDDIDRFQRRYSK